VRLHAVIAKDGSIKDLEVLSGDPLLADAALKAVRQWRYKPTLLDGQPKEVTTTIDVVFALNKNP
jgi:protein TonB